MERVPYVYPDIAREANVDGTVIVDALVCEHGSVVRTQLRKSIPMLDASALTAVAQWTFTPARDSSGTISCWIEVPVKFSLK